MAGQILVAKTSAAFSFDGKSVILSAGRTTVREGHPILEGREALFEPMKVDFELDSEAPDDPPPVETPPTSDPVEPPADQRPVTAAEVRAWAANNGIDVPAKGRLPEAVMDQYLAAQGAQD